MAKQFLNITAETNFYLYGVSSHLKDYRFIWMLNKALKTDFVKVDFFENIESRQSFSTYHYQIDFSNIYVISNKSQGGFLLKKAKQIDYWIKMDYNTDEKIKSDWILQLKNIDDVLATVEIIDYKQKEHFIF